MSNNIEGVTHEQMDKVLETITRILELHAGKIFTELNIKLLKIFKNDVPIRLLGYAYWKMLSAMSDGAINFFCHQTGVEQKNVVQAFNEWGAFTQQMQNTHHRTLQ